MIKIKAFRNILYFVLVFAIFLVGNNFNIVNAYSVKTKEQPINEILTYINRQRTTSENILYRNKQLFINKDFIDNNFYTINNYNSNTKTLTIKNIDYELVFTLGSNNIVVNGKKISMSNEINSLPFIDNNKMYIPLEFLLGYLDEDYIYDVSLDNEKNNLCVYIDLKENEVSIDEIKKGIRETQIKTTEIEQEQLVKILSDDLKKQDAELVSLEFNSSTIGGKDTDFSEEWNIRYRAKNNKKIFSQDISIYPLTKEQKYLVKFLEPKRVSKKQYSILIQSDINDEKEFKERLKVSNLLNKLMRVDSVNDFVFVKSFKEKYNNKNYTIYELQINDFKYKVENFLNSMFVNQLKQYNKKIKIIKTNTNNKNTEDVVSSVITYPNSMEIVTKSGKYIIQ